ncbi:hypothetical protein PUNSTDRAFT_91391 [Punctularia strigosozonata HHB-11173 SS5]|uniref:uncharacterized protein n=1 Tax=Punctularia strigosozonata (strain HHB-11173) TaxID=741275 RepID=UPI0004416D16|nr:uncharacterized protein PUNSTDRAFT_91391 [Punctularia strigosozonata HHB-11173 SS5]EIN05794.1 hypothetical protein PUNSTDRAFT_91391 [Punctularia strigosozonata HHB-11173 SS5]
MAPTWLTETSAPTRRELVLTAALLAFLLYTFTGSRIDPHAAQGLIRDEDLVVDSEATKEVALAPEDTVLRWTPGKGDIPRTNVVAHVPGWTIFDRLYALNGTLYVVTDNITAVPPRKLIISTAVPIHNGKVEEMRRAPTDREMQYITPKQAEKLFGADGLASADRVDGVTWYANDPPQFITHYYHFSAELFFGFWRTYSSLDPLIPSTGVTSLPPPRRMLFAHTDSDRWRDYASMNQFVIRAAFPSITMEFSHDWEARNAFRIADTEIWSNDTSTAVAGGKRQAQVKYAANGDGIGRPIVFDRVVLADRAAAMHGYNFLRTQRTASAPFALPGSVHWWAAVRGNIMRYSGVGDHDADKPVITYISRQDWGRRMLIPEDHERLMQELYKLRDERGYEVNVVSMDKLSRIDQLILSGRTTIMMGVHGNGLTSLVWMKPSAKSTVMEFFYPGGFAHDYEWTTRALGMVHYGFWGDRAFTRPNTPPVAYPPGFQGNEIPIDGVLVAQYCVDRLELVQELDES